MKLGWTETLHSRRILPSRGDSSTLHSYFSVAASTAGPTLSVNLLPSDAAEDFSRLRICWEGRAAAYLYALYIRCCCCRSIMGSQNFSSDNLLPSDFILFSGENSISQKYLVKMNSELWQTLPTTRTINHLSQTPSWNRLRTQF